MQEAKSAQDFSLWIRNCFCSSRTGFVYIPMLLKRIFTEPHVQLGAGLVALLMKL